MSQMGKRRVKLFALEKILIFIDLQWPSFASMLFAYTRLPDQEKGVEGTEKFKGQVLWPLTNVDPSKTNRK